MNEQSILLILILAATACTLYLYLWKAKKEIEYKKDERWHLIQIKANKAANFANYIPVLLVAVGETILLYTDKQATISLNRVFLFIMLFIGLRNGIELFALKYFDLRM